MDDIDGFSLCQVRCQIVVESVERNLPKVDCIAMSKMVHQTNDWLISGRHMIGFGTCGHFPNRDSTCSKETQLTLPVAVHVHVW